MQTETIGDATRDDVTPGDVLNVARYPLHDPGARAHVIELGRRQLAEDGCAVLPDFVTADAVRRMVGEANAARPRTHRRDLMLGAYDHEAPDDLPEDHALRRKSPYTMSVAASDLLPGDGAIQRLYHWDGLTRLIADFLGEPSLYRVADPLLCCTLTYLSKGDQHGWHFDGNDFVVSLLLQAPEAGGAFEYAPNIRSDGDEHYDDVQAVMEERSPLLKRKAVTPGTLMLFCGRRALHRVSPVVGGRERIIALFSYDRAPDMHYSTRTRMNAVGRTEALA
jgi:hypothetical protein